MATKADVEQEFLLHEVALLPDEVEFKYLVQIGHALRRARNWAIIQYNESRIEAGGYGGYEVEQVTTLFTKARRKPKKKKRKRKRKRKKKTQNAQQVVKKPQRRPLPPRDTSLCRNLSWTSWISLSLFHREFWDLARQYVAGDVPTMRGWHHAKQFVLDAEDVRLSECGRLLGIVTEEWDYIYDHWDDYDDEEDLERWIIWIEMDRPLAIEQELLVRAEIRQENHQWFAKVFEEVLPDKGENVVAVSLGRPMTAMTDGRQGLLIPYTGEPRATSLPILDWVIARHAGQIIIGSDGNTSEMCQDLKSVLEGMGFDVAIVEESGASKRCNICKFHGKALRFRACKQCGLLWQSEMGRASTILAKFHGHDNEQGSRLYPHTIHTHEAAEWPGW